MASTAATAWAAVSKTRSRATTATSRTARASPCRWNCATTRATTAYYQLWYSRQATEVDDGVETHDADVEYLHIGGTLPYGGWEHAQPYFAAGIGATRFSASGADTEDRTNFSGSAAFGLEIPLARHAAIRLEARGYLTLVDTDSAFFCRSDDGEGVCRIVASGSSIFQAEALAGIVLRF